MPIDHCPSELIDRGSIADQHKVVVALGMHRSGTSALTAALPLFGVDIGDVSEHLSLPSQESRDTNVKGYFEVEAIVGYHDRILAGMETSWDRVGPFPQGWVDLPATQQLRQELRDYLKSRFGSAKLWGFKDPRTCRLLPLWQSIFKEMAVTDHYLIIVRNPLNVALSLKKRDGFTVEKGLALWLAHMLPAVIQTAEKPRVIIDYDKALGNPQIELRRIAKVMKLAWPGKESTVEQYCQHFLDRQMRHHFCSEEELNRYSSVSPVIKDAYNALSRAGNNTITNETLTQIFLELSSTVNKSRFLLSYIQQLENRKIMANAKESGADPLRVFCQVFYNQEQLGFHEEMSNMEGLKSSDTEVLHTNMIEIPQHVSAIRVDPINAPAIIKNIEIEIKANNGGGNKIPITMGYVGMVQLGKQEWIAVGCDPQIIIANINLSAGGTIRISFIYRLISESEMAIRMREIAVKADELESEVNCKKDEISKLYGGLGEREQALAAKDTEIVHLTEELKREIQRRSAQEKAAKELASSTEMIDSLQKQLGNVQTAMDSLRGSLSWKITMPLRFVRHLQLRIWGK